MGIFRDIKDLTLGKIQRRATIQRLQLKEAQLQSKLTESLFDTADSIVNFNDEFEGWVLLDDPSFWQKNKNVGTLDQMRAAMRQLVWKSGVAQGAIEAVADYVVGTGLTYDYQLPKEFDEAQKDALEAARDEANDLWKEFAERTQWCLLEAQLMQIADRDGESFARMFVGNDGTLDVRYVSAEDVRDDSGKYPWGVVTAKDDEQKIEGYVLRADAGGEGETVPADDMIHLAFNCDPDVPRGVPTLWPVRENVLRAEKIMKNVAKLAEIQAAIAVVRRHAYPITQTNGEAWLDVQADNVKTNPWTGKSLRQTFMPSGAILDVGTATDLEFPTAGASLDKFPAALLMQLRPIAVRMGLPDFVVSGDVSTTNFASVFISIAPSTKRLQRKQSKVLSVLGQVHDRVLNAAIAAGILDPIAALLVCSVTGPEVSNRDEVATTNKREVLFRNKILSAKTWTAEEGYVFDEEQQNIEDEKAAMVGTNPLPDPAAMNIGPDGKPIDPNLPITAPGVLPQNPKGVTPPGLAASAAAAAAAGG